MAEAKDVVKSAPKSQLITCLSLVKLINRDQDKLPEGDRTNTIQLTLSLLERVESSAERDSAAIKILKGEYAAQYNLGFKKVAEIVEADVTKEFQAQREPVDIASELAQIIGKQAKAKGPYERSKRLIGDVAEMDRILSEGGKSSGGKSSGTLKRGSVKKRLMKPKPPKGKWRLRTASQYRKKGRMKKGMNK